MSADAGPLLIIVTGPSGAGKTTLAHQIAAELRLPLLYRDGLKETLYESLGWSDLAWSRRLGAASYDLLYHVLEMLLAAGVGAVVESNFTLKFAAPRWSQLQQQYGFWAIQIFCTAPAHVLHERIRARVQSGERHPGHVELLTEGQLIPQHESAEFGFLPLQGATLEIDTGDFTLIDSAALIESIRRLAAREHSTGPG
jgi:predicted kinase